MNKNCQLNPNIDCFLFSIFNAGVYMELFKGDRKMYELIFILYISYIILAYIKEFN